jgi:hypothetical protein
MKEGVLAYFIPLHAVFDSTKRPAAGRTRQKREREDRPKNKLPASAREAMDQKTKRSKPPIMFTIAPVI